jgi:hypothetical protein
MTLISHYMTFPILSHHKFADVSLNLMLMTLSSHFPLRLPYKKEGKKSIFTFLLFYLVRSR